MISIRIHLTAHPEKQTEFEQVMLMLKDEISFENGCLGCRVFQNREAPTEYLFLEEWKSLATAQHHLISKNLAILSGAKSLLASDISVSLKNYAPQEKLEKAYKKRLS